MLQVQDKLISLDVIETAFKCDLNKCKGACCLHGDSGAPLEEEEKKILNKIFPKVKPYLSKEHLKTLTKEGLYYKDKEGDWVTTLYKGKQCAFSVIENDIYYCAIEKAFMDKKIDFRKPISCHLYPIRIKKYDGFEAVNFDDWKICKPALLNGKNNNLPLFRFLKESLIKKYGESWYKELEETVNEYKSQKTRSIS